MEKSTTDWRFFGSLIERGASIILVMYLGVCVLVFVTYSAIATSYPYSLDYGEAPLINHAMSIANGDPVYRSDLSTPPYTIANYPPLYITVLSPLVAIFGPHFWQGRLISILSAVGVAFGLGGITWNLTRNRLASVAGGAIFLAFPYAVQWSGLARVDLLALVCSACALYVATRDKVSLRQSVIIALLLVAAVYTRQSYGLAAPAAAFIWLLWRNRKQALQVLAISLVTGLALLGVLQLISRGGFTYNIVSANVNPFSWDTVLRYARELRTYAPILVLVAIGYCVFARPRYRGWHLLIPYLLGALLSAITVGKIGSNVNYLLELCAALSLVTGVTLSWSGRLVPDGGDNPEIAHSGFRVISKSLVRAAILILVAIQAILLLRVTLQSPVADLSYRREGYKDFEYLIWLVGREKEPVLADEFMGAMTLNNRSLYLQPFEMTQLANAKKWDQTPLLTQIENQAFPYVLIHHYQGYPVYLERWTPQMLDAITSNYVASENLADTILFERRNADESLVDVGQKCPDAAWNLPSNTEMGIWWHNRHLYLTGMGPEGVVPVYAVADGELTRSSDWVGAVAIRHQDPLNPGRMIWTYYNGMADAAGHQSYVQSAFPPGTDGVAVAEGQLLGYQGRWQGNLGYTHVQFAIFPEYEPGVFPEHLTNPTSVADDSIPEGKRLALDPTQYTGSVRSQVYGEIVWLSPRCGTQ